MRLIDADALIANLKKDPLFKLVEQYGISGVIEAQLTVDAVPVVRCLDCVYYDNPHVEKDGERFEYKDMPNEAFEDLGTGLVNSNYGINVGGRCCRDYNTGYADDKRIFVPETNYCGRAVRKEE